MLLTRQVVDFKPPAEQWAYARISVAREKGPKRSEKTSVQIERIQQWRARWGLAPIPPERIFVDDDKSALLIDNRPEYDRLVKEMTAGNVPESGVCRIEDRFGRNVEELERTFRRLREGKVRAPQLWTIEDRRYDLWTTQGRGDLRREIERGQAESERISMRVGDFHRKAAAEGVHVGRRPFGFADARTMEHDPTEKAMLEEARDWVLAERSLNSLCAKWNAEDRLTATGAQWSTSTLHSHLMHPRMIGVRVYDGAAVEGGRPLMVKGTWAPIFTPGQQNRMRAILSRRGAKGRKPAQPYWLHGIARTAEGDPMHGKLMGGRRYYVGPGVQVLEADLDAIVEARFFDRLGELKVTGTRDMAKERARVERQMAEAQAKQERLFRRYVAKRSLTEDQFDTLAAPLLEAIRECELRLAELDGSARDRAVDDELSNPTSLEVRWLRGDFTVEQRRRMLRRVLVSLQVKPAGARGKAARLAHHPERVGHFRWSV